MALKEYKPETTFPGRMGRTLGESGPAWPASLCAKSSAPNVLFIVLGGGLSVGRAPGSAVSSLSPFAFTGRIFRVAVDVTGKMTQDAEEEAKAHARRRWRGTRATLGSRDLLVS